VEVVRGRGIAYRYNVAARIWLVAAGASLLLPASARLGYWLPLHLALAGAVSIAISGNMMSFAATLTATKGPGPALVGVQFAAVNLGAAAIAVGYTTDRDALVAAGGASFVFATLLLLVVLRNAWRTALNRRHPLPLAMYATAVLAVVAGGTIGALLGGDAVSSAAFVSLRDAHMTINVLGWMSITIAATLVTLLPTVLRIRIPPWNGPLAAVCLVGGLALLATGLASGTTWLAGVGASVYLLGGIQLAVLLVRGLRAPRKWPAPVGAKHMAFGVTWYVCGAVALVIATFDGSFDAFVPVFEVVFVCGWGLQILLGSWLYLLPMARPGTPDGRRLWLTAVEYAANVQVAGVNVGLALVAVSAARWVSGTVGTMGAALAIGAAAFGLGKTWLYPALALLPATRERARTLWRV
jgi:nitrite reductase (NO-forming)